MTLLQANAWLKSYRVFSRLTLLSSFGMMVWVTYWSMRFAGTSALSGTEVAAVIAVVQVPASTLFASVFKTYSGKQNDMKQHIYPVEDLKPHNPVIHNSLNERESYEEGRKLQ